MKLKNVIALSLLGICGGEYAISTNNINHVCAAKTKYQKINKEIASNLKQQKGWANGTLDENGSSTDSGSANDEFDWANYVTKIKYIGKNKINIYVTSNFNTLSEENKTDSIMKAENSAAAILLDHKKIKENDTIKGLKVKIITNDKIIGTSIGYHSYSFN
nr:MAG TPA: hypothetical protein [Caudoviricetes sp.]